MTKACVIRRDAQTITLRVPIKIRKRGHRKQIITPSGGDAFFPSRGTVDGTILKALARAHRWKKLLETGKHASIADLARAEKINESYLCRILRLTLIAPDIVEEIMDGRQSQMLQVGDLLGQWPVDWGEQRERITAQYC